MPKSTKRSTKVHSSSSEGQDHRNHLALLLPATILSLTVALSPEDTEVLAYLISYHNKGKSVVAAKSLNYAADVASDVHPPMFGCNCFRCYTSFWSRWNSSLNRDLIHEVIEAYEEELSQKKPSKTKKKRKNNNKVCSVDDDRSSTELQVEHRGGEVASGEENCGIGAGGIEYPPEKGSSVKKVISFICEKIWGSWTNRA